MVMKYELKNGVAIIKKKDVQEVGEYLKKVTDKNGGELTPELIVNESKSKKSVLHQYFEWDNVKAGEKFRKHQARLIIGAVVEVVHSNGTSKNMRSWFSVNNEKGDKVYVTLQTVIKTPSYAQQMIRDAQQYIKYLNDVLEMFYEHL